jgi:hypothetical protein
MLERDYDFNPGGQLDLATQWSRSRLHLSNRDQQPLYSISLDAHSHDTIKKRDQYVVGGWDRVE